MQQKKIIIAALTVSLILTGKMLHAGRTSGFCCKNLKSVVKDLVVTPRATEARPAANTDMPAPLLPTVLYF